MFPSLIVLRDAHFSIGLRAHSDSARRGVERLIDGLLAKNSESAQRRQPALQVSGLVGVCG